jgi:hypothetical protein
VKLAPVAAIHSIPIREVPTQSLGVSHYVTSGTYPQVAGSGEWRSVNRALFSSFAGTEAQFARAARNELQGLGPILPSESGLYKTAPDESLMSASSKIISIMLPTDSAYPAGVFTEDWQSVTVLVPSGARVDLLQRLFKDPAAALRIISIDTFRGISSGNSPADKCVQMLYAPLKVGVGTAPGGFAPRQTNYRFMALTSDGLAIGIPQGQVASDSCGSVSFKIRYTSLEHYLSKGGKQLISWVRQPFKS